jgi:lipoprotein-releasing system permease protein
MYKLILCWRYLRTRYLAFACIISVMLGVATLIVVNSVMNGFSTKLRALLHNVLSDIVIETPNMDGFADPFGKMARIRKDTYLNEQIEAMAVTLECFAMIQFRHTDGQIATRPVRVIGIEMDSRTQVGGFWENLSSYQDRKVKNEPIPPASFEIPKHLADAYMNAEERLKQDREIEQWFPQQQKVDSNFGIPEGLQDLFKKDPTQKPLPPPMRVPYVARLPKGAVVGQLIAFSKYRDPETGNLIEVQAIHPGDNIVLTTVSGQRLTPVYDSFVAVDFFKSGMSEYDANCVFVPLDHLQSLRNMDNRATNILIKLKNYGEADKVTKALAKAFEHEPLGIHTWEEKQGSLLKAIDIEKGILDVLLFMIIAVAGFGILAIFSMIVSEKTRDIGILKALGASSGGVMKIFLTYGLLLGAIGALLGTILGLEITWHINEVEAFIALVTGQKVFDPGIYYFQQIPTEVSPWAVTIVNLGSVAIATVFSILPALRAAMLHPVAALRYE